MAGFCLDLAVWGSGAALVAYLTKLVRPSAVLDRMANTGLFVVLVAALSALASTLGTARSVPAWTLLVAPVVILYGLLETEFATRLLGVVPACLVLWAGTTMGAGTNLPSAGQGWATLTSTGILVAMAFLGLSAGAWTLILPLRVVPSVQARKTSRLFVLNPPVLAELAFRCNGWALPFLTGATAAALLGVRPGQVHGEVFLWLLAALVGSMGYTALARRDGPSWAISLLAGALLASAWAWRGLGLSS